MRTHQISFIAGLLVLLTAYALSAESPNPHLALVDISSRIDMVANLNFTGRMISGGALSLGGLVVGSLSTAAWYQAGKTTYYPPVYAMAGDSGEYRDPGMNLDYGYPYQSVDYSSMVGMASGAGLLAGGILTLLVPTQPEEIQAAIKTGQKEHQTDAELYVMARARLESWANMECNTRVSTGVATLGLTAWLVFGNNGIAYNFSTDNSLLYPTLFSLISGVLTLAIESPGEAAWRAHKNLFPALP